MASRFTSGGLIDSSGDVVKPDDTSSATAESAAAVAPKNAEWEAVQRELEAERKRREEKRIKAASGEEKSLYEILQANKEAKQAAFEEQNKIRNQFRALDDDEIDFLDEVKEKQRKEEEERKRELEEGLRAFREAKKSGGAAGADGENGDGIEDGDGVGEGWEVGGRKRKRGKGRGKEVKGLVRRKVDHGVDGDNDAAEWEVVKGEEKAKVEVPTVTKAEETKSMLPATGAGLGLVAYGSDDSDDE